MRIVAHPRDAVEWHSSIAKEFDSRYARDNEFAARHAEWIRVIDKYSNSGGFAIDVGCGSGSLTVRLAERNHRVVAIDGSTTMLELARAKVATSGLKHVEFRCCDISALAQAPQGAADLIICSSVLEYVVDFEATMHLLLKTLRDNGVIIFSLPNSQSLFRRFEPWLFRCTGRPRYYQFVRHVRSLDAIERFLRSSGMRVLEHTYYARTPGLSWLLRPLGLKQYSDNLFLIAAQRQ